MTNGTIPILGQPSNADGGSLLKIRRALISVSDKRGIIQLATALRNFNIQIISTGGTYTALKEAGFDVKQVSEISGFPEIMDGRVKTIHPKILGGILGIADNPKHVEQMKEHDIESIELVVVNLYPFEQTIANDEVRLETAIENIDIGGPTMVRAAAKNFRHCAVVVNPGLYGIIAEELQSHDGCLTEHTRFHLACSAFQHTAHYDSVIAGYLRGLTSPTGFPETYTVSYRRAQDLRYGENPHQSASLYGHFNEYFVKLHGKELSYNNILDINTAAHICAEFNEPTAVIVKHGNPCGVASASSLSDAYRIALATDSKSAYGGIVALNRSLDLPTAEILNEIFLEVVIAPEFEPRVVELLMKKKDRRVMQQKVNLRTLRDLDVRSVAGGLLVQDPDQHRMHRDQLRVVTKRAPNADELAAMIFAWNIAKHVKSNAIVYARGDRTLGIGAGQMSRVDSSMMAALKAKEAGLDLQGCAVASDAFFPFADGMLEAVKVGATAVIQPGGSVRDQDVIKAADDHDVAMVFTGIRHFRH